MVFTITLGADLLYTVYRTVETLEFSAILVFTGYFVTHVSILTSDISNIIHIISSVNIQNVLLPQSFNFMISRRFGTYL